jgi:hypothetical protein
MACIVEYDFPAVIRAAKPRSRVERPVVCRLKGRTVLSEVSQSEAPVAAIVKRRFGRSKYRSFEGGLFVTVADFARLDQLDDLHGFLRRTGVEQRLFAEIAENMSSYREAQIWPEGVKHTLDAIRSTVPVDHQPTEALRPYARDIRLLACLPEHDELNFTENTQDDIALAVSRIDELILRSVLVCDGKVICRTPEPCLAVGRDVNSTGGRIVKMSQGDVSFYARRHHEPVLHAVVLDAYWSDVEDACYPLTEFADARRLATEMLGDFPEENRKSTFVTDIENVEIFDPAAFAHPVGQAEMIRLADRVFHHATKATRTPSRPKIFRKIVSEDFIETILGFEAALDPDDGDIDQVEEALEAMLAAIAEDPAHMHAIGIDTAAFTRGIERGLDRWDNRTVDIAPSSLSGRLHIA